MRQEVLEICFICDNGYVMPTTVAITSLIQSKKDSTRCNIYIIADELTEENERHFVELGSDGVAIRVLRKSARALKALHSYAQNSICVATPSALLKFSLGETLPHLDKVLYADGDVIFRKDVLDLFNVELGENLVAAAPDTGILYSQRPILRAVKMYFNSGIMLLNLKKMREGKYAEKLIDAKRRSTDTSLMDQNILNQVFDGRVLPLPVRYNCLFVNLVRAFYAGAFRFRRFNEKFSTDYAGFQDLLDDTVVVHYSSKDKPWKVSNTPLADEWHKMYALSSYGSQPLVRTVSSERYCSFDYLGPAGRERSIVVSLTSFPRRMATVHVALESLLAQTLKPDRIILWLAKEEFPDALESLPQSLLELLDKGVEIGWADRNLRAYKKFYYALRDNPEALVITVDDDLVSPENLVASLYCSYLRHPDCISALRTHRMLFSEDGRLLPYRKWQMTCIDYVNRPNLALFATTGAGVLYPPHVVPAAALDADVFMSLCPCADDVWMKLITASAGIPVVNPCHARCVLDIVDGSQDAALWEENVLAGGNDAQIDAVSKWCSQALLHGQSVLEVIRQGSRSAEIQDADIQPPTPVRSTVRPKVSVIVPICNSALYLEKCLATLEQQTLRDIEIICVDDGSTDDPFPGLQRHLVKDERIGLIRQVRTGLAEACKRGLAAARGDYVVFQPATGFCDGDFLLRLHKLASEKDCDVVISGWFIHNSDVNRVEECHCFAKKLVDLPAGFSPAGLAGCSLADFWEMPWNKLVRREFLNMRDISFPGGTASDGAVYFSAIVLLAASRIGIVNRALVYQRALRSREILARTDQTPCSIVAALVKLREKLEADGIYPQFDLFYKRLALSSCLQRLMDFTTSRGFRELYDYLRRVGFGLLGVDEISFKDVGWPLYRLFAALKENEDFLPFVLEMEIQTKGRVAGVRRSAYEGEIKRSNAYAETRKVMAELTASRANLDAAQKGLAKTMAESAKTQRQNLALQKDIAALRREVCSLKESESYCLGLFLTWPLRKGWGGIKCLRENGFQYTIRHVIGKILRLFGSKVKW